MSEPLISVIVTSKNAEKTIDKCVRSILEQDYPLFELIVVNDGSSDKTGELLKAYAQRIIAITHLKSAGPAQSRNQAAEVAQGEYLAFTDADCVVAGSWLNELMKGFTGPQVASVGGRQEIPEDEAPFGSLVSIFLQRAGLLTDYMGKAGTQIVSVSHNASCNVIYKKDIFLASHGFLPRLWPGEDVELDYRLKKSGCVLNNNPSAVVRHYRPKNLSSFNRMMFRYGHAQGILVRRYSIFRKTQTIPFFSAGLLLFSVFLAFKNMVTLLIFMAFCLSGAIVWARFDLKMLVLFVGALFSWNFGFLKGYLAKPYS